MTKIGKAFSTAKQNLFEEAAGKINKNATLFTVFAVAMIVVTGVSLANGDQGWWIGSLAITFTFALVFFFFNARVLLKAAISLFVAMVTANFSLQAGVVYDPTTSIGLVWMTAHLFLFTVVIAISYLMMGHRSRWTGSIIAMITTFFVGSTLLPLIEPLYGIILSILTGIGIFLLFYKYSGIISAKLSKMPTNIDSEEYDEILMRRASKENWNIRKISSKKLFSKTSQTDYLVWNDERAYLLHPVKLDNKFGVDSNRRGMKLVHNGYSITNWLLLLINNIPLWKTRNAKISLILLDVDDTNGKKAETIGVAIPDSNKRIPVGIYPAARLLSESTSPRAELSKIDSTYKPIFENIKTILGGGLLTDKQKEAMNDIGRTNSSEYIETVEQDLVDV